MYCILTERYTAGKELFLCYCFTSDYLVKDEGALERKLASMLAFSANLTNC